MTRGLDAHPRAAQAVGSLEARQPTEACGLSAGIWARGECGALREDRDRVCTCASTAAAVVSACSGHSKLKFDVTHISVWAQALSQDTYTAVDMAVAPVPLALPASAHLARLDGTTMRFQLLLSRTPALGSLPRCGWPSRTASVGDSRMQRLLTLGTVCQLRSVSRCALQGIDVCIPMLTKPARAMTALLSRCER